MLKYIDESKKPLSIALITIILSALLYFPSGCSGESEDVTIAAVPTELNALVYIAEEQNFFSDNGLQVILKDYDSGAAAAAGMLNGEANLALAAEFPIVRQVFSEKDIVNLGTVAKYENTYILWLADSGIRTINDLKGKRIGVTLQTISEFYLGRILELNNIGIKEVILIDIKAAGAGEALINGNVDAVVTWEPWAHQIQMRLADKVITVEAQSSQYAYWNLVSTTGWTNEHTKTIERLLKSLAKAEDYIINHQNESKNIIKDTMNFDDEFLSTIWPRYQFSLSIDQSLITAMEDEARWMIDSGLTVEKQVPNFTDYVYEDALKQIKPEAVTIIK